MPVETVNTPQDLNVLYPEATDDISAGDDHLRNTKKALKRLCWEEVGTYSASAVASVSTYTQFGAFVEGYDYLLVVDAAYLSGAGITLNVRATTGGGSADTGANYALARVLISAAETGTHSTGQSTIAMAANFSDSATERGGFSFFLSNPGGTANPRKTSHHVLMISSASVATSIQGSAYYVSGTAMDGIQVYPASGTITAGTFKLYRRFRP